jgi:hypothetical protein
MFTELHAIYKPRGHYTTHRLMTRQQQYANTLSVELKGSAVLIPTPVNRHEQYASPCR